MTDGLDFTPGTKDGFSFRRSVSMVRAFASVHVATELHGGGYPLLRPLWDYRSTPVPHRDLPAFRAELITLIKAMLRSHEDQAILDELDDLVVFVTEMESMGLGVHVDGP